MIGGLTLSSDFILRIPALIVALTFHEYAHALMADSLGDATPRLTGRLTLNPLAHIDPLGLLSLWLFRFGWAKPVQVNPYRFRDPRRGMLLVGLAGPLMNLVLAFISMWAFKLMRISIWSWTPSLAAQLARMLVMYNVWLLVFNIIPIPPLDGSRILAGILPRSSSSLLEEIESKGWIILLALVWTGMIGRIMDPLVIGVLSTLDVATGMLVP